MEMSPRNHKVMRMIAEMSIDRASRSLSKMVKAGARIDLERAEVVNVSSVTKKINEENVEVMGAVVDLEGDAPFKFLFLTEAMNSLTLAELILRKERGSIKNFEVYARSAIQEIGNLLASAVANVFSLDLGIQISPTPPLVVHDFIGAIFEEYMIGAAQERNDILMIESKFSIIQHDVKCEMYVLPLTKSEEIIAEKLEQYQSKEGK